MLIISIVLCDQANQLRLINELLVLLFLCIPHSFLFVCCIQINGATSTTVGKHCFHYHLHTDSYALCITRSLGFP